MRREQQLALDARPTENVPWVPFTQRPMAATQRGKSATEKETATQ